MFFRDRRLQVIGDPRADQRHLPPAIPVVNKAGNNSCDLACMTENKHMQLTTSKMAPPRKQPLRQLKRRHTLNGSGERRPLALDFNERTKIVDDLESQACFISAAHWPSSRRRASR